MTCDAKKEIPNSKLEGETHGFCCEEHGKVWEEWAYLPSPKCSLTDYFKARESIKRVSKDGFLPRLS